MSENVRQPIRTSAPSGVGQLIVRSSLGRGRLGDAKSSCPNREKRAPALPRSLMAKRPIEVGLIGREGMTGLPVVLGNDRNSNEVFMQAAGHGHHRCAAQG